MAAFLSAKVENRVAARPPKFNHDAECLRISWFPGPPGALRTTDLQRRLNGVLLQDSPLDPLCNTSEFAVLIRREEETVRRMIRRREIAATGRPALINFSEALRYGLTVDDARELLIAIRSASYARAAA